LTTPPREEGKKEGRKEGKKEGKKGRRKEGREEGERREEINGLRVPEHCKGQNSVSFAPIGLKLQQ